MKELLELEYILEIQNTCAKAVKFTLKGNIVTDVEFLGGGCPGNSKAVPKLIEGMTVEEIAKRIKGIVCGRRGTSCADQLAQAIIKAYEESKK